MAKIKWLIMMSILFLTACSREVGIELISVRADIIQEENITHSVSDQTKRVEYVPTSLYYESELENTERQIDSSDRLKLYVEPSPELSGEIQRIIGTPRGTGWNWSGPPMPFKSNEIKTATNHLHLGAYKDDSKIPVFPPGR